MPVEIERGRVKGVGVRRTQCVMRVLIVSGVESVEEHNAACRTASFASVYLFRVQRLILRWAGELEFSADWVFHQRRMRKFFLVLSSPSS